MSVRVPAAQARVCYPPDARHSIVSQQVLSRRGGSVDDAGMITHALVRQPFLVCDILQANLDNSKIGYCQSMGITDLVGSVEDGGREGFHQNVMLLAAVNLVTN